MEIAIIKSWRYNGKIFRSFCLTHLSRIGEFKDNMQCDSSMLMPSSHQ